MTTSHTFAALRADEIGADDGRPPIVLLHGLTFDRRIWAPVIEAIDACDPGRRVIALDLPGHGESPACPPHDLDRVAALVNQALQAAAATAPVVVGHSMSGGLASIYAARYPTSGVVNVDQPPFIAEFAKLVRRLEPGLRGAAFDQIWRDVFFASFHLELLPAPARELVIRNSHPDQAVVLSYWQMVLESPIEELDAMVRDMMTQLAAQGVPYLMVMGSTLPTAVRDAMKDLGQQPTIVEWVDTGHFPHLAHPSEFARLCTQVGRPTSVSR